MLDAFAVLVLVFCAESMAVEHHVAVLHSYKQPHVPANLKSLLKRREDLLKESLELEYKGVMWFYKARFGQ